MKKLVGFLLAIVIVGLFSIEYSIAQSQTNKKQSQEQTSVRNRQFVDLNKDGICDNFIDANKDGRCDNCQRQGVASGIRMGRHYESGKGGGLRIRQFVDENKDGVCDNYQNRHERWKNLRLKK